MYNAFHADGADRIMHVTSPLPRRARLLRLTRRVLIAVFLVVFVECAWFNLPYVLSIGASGDSVSARNELGPGTFPTCCRSARVAIASPRATSSARSCSAQPSECSR